MGRKAKRPLWFKLWLRHRPMLEVTPDAVVGRAIKAALNYFETGEVETLNQLEMMVFSAIRSDADDANLQYYLDTENGKRGGRPKRAPEEKPPVTENNPPFTFITQAEADAEAEAEAEDNTVYSSAVSLLNALSGSSFRDTTKATRKVIRARQAEGYSLADLETVIRHQCALWSKDEKMRKYLRPETLFGSKFESYLSDARRAAPREESTYTLAPLEDPWDAAVKEAQYV